MRKNKITINMRVYNISDLHNNINPQSSNNIIVTGVTGQDGSYMVDYLLDNTNYNIFGGVRRLSVSNYTNIKHLEDNPRFKLVNFDLTDPHTISLLVNILKPAYFINLAAQTFVGSSWEFPAQTWECNSTGVIHILEAIRKYVPTCRFYNAGSSEEYGNVEYKPQDEKHPLKPRSPYGASKCAARHIVKVYRESYNIYAIQGLLYNHESPRRGEEFVTRKITKGLALITNTIKNNITYNKYTKTKCIELGNLDAMRDWSFAGDFVDGIWRMLNQDKYNSSVFKNLSFDEYTQNIQEYILSSNKTHTVRNFIDVAFKICIDNIQQHIKDINFNMGKNVSLSLDHNGNGLDEQYNIILSNSSYVYPCIQINKDFYRPAEVDLLWGNSNRARNELQWEPKISFEELIKMMVNHDILQTAKI